MTLSSQSPRWERVRALARMPVARAIDRLDVEAIARLLKRPLPIEAESR